MDIKTILTCLFVINLFMGLYTFIIKKTQPTFKGINYWIISNLMIALGYYLLSLRGVISDFLSILIAQTLFYSAGFVRIFGLERFFDKIPNFKIKIIYIISLTIYLILFTFFIYYHDNVLARTVISGLFLSGLSIYTGMMVINNKPQNKKFVYIATAITFWLFALIFLVRIVCWIAFPEVRGLFTHAFINSLQFASSMMIDISWTTMFFVIHNQKLTNKLLESEEKFRVIFEKNASAMAIINPDTTIEMVNEEYLKIGMYKMDEVIGKSWTSQIAPTDLPRLMEYNNKRLKDQSNAPDKYEFSFIRNDGEILHALTSIALIPGINKIIASFTDISDRKKTELQLIELANELSNLNQNKNLFFSIIAHDLRNPFSSIISLSGFLLDDKKITNDPELKNEIAAINHVAKQSYYLLEDLLAWAKSQDGKLRFEPQTINIAALCHDIYDTVRVQASNKNITLRIPQSTTYVFADINMIRTIMRNLVSNAVKYTKQGGLIEISVEIGKDEDTITIADNGVGIKPENIEKLWTIAQKYTTKGTANESGSGLGLILCKEFIEKHGGKIWVETAFGFGSKFKFTLPKGNQ